MTNYLVSVGVPVYNAEKYIERCVKSILSQSYVNLEVVFVDDHSQDNSVEIINKVAKVFPNRKEQIKIICHTSNQGVAVARNTLLDSFTGDFFTFVDADDYLTPHAISRLVSRQCQDNCDMVSGAYMKYFGSDYEIHNENYGLGVEDLLKRCCCTQSCHENVARLFRTSLFRNPPIRYLPGVKIGEDWVFMVEVLLQMQHVASINDIVYVYDFTNNMSAMHQITKNNGDYLLADVNVLLSIKQLVKSRGAVYNDGVEKLMSKKIENGLIEAYNTKNRNLFNKLKNYISLIDSSNINDKYYIKKASIGPILSIETYFVYFWLRSFYYKLKNLYRRICFQSW